MKNSDPAMKMDFKIRTLHSGKGLCCSGERKWASVEVKEIRK